jgi:hypothetical protein
MHRTPSVLALLAFALAFLAITAGPALARDDGGDRVEGKLTAVTANSITINGMTIPVSASAKVEVAGKRVPLSALVVGAFTQARLVVGVAVKVEQ